MPADDSLLDRLHVRQTDRATASAYRVAGLADAEVARVAGAEIVEAFVDQAVAVIVQAVAVFGRGLTGLGVADVTASCSG